MVKQASRARKKDSGKADEKPWLEWAASSLGVVIALVFVTLLGWEALNHDGKPPAVLVETVRIAEHPGGYTLEIRARNIADATAADVQIEGTLRRESEIVEVARTRLDYLPGNSDRTAGLFFTRDPRAHEIELRALGYSEP